MERNPELINNIGVRSKLEIDLRMDSVIGRKPMISVTGRSVISLISNGLGNGNPDLQAFSVYSEA